MSEIPDGLKPDTAYECFVAYSKDGRLRVFIKDQDRPRVYDITERLREQFQAEKPQ